MIRKILVLDIETLPLDARIWRLGDQVVRHNQLKYTAKFVDIICVSYMWLGDNKVYTLSVDPDNQEQSKIELLEKIDKLAREALAIIGKNNVRFDDKHLNTLRLKYKTDPAPWWTSACNDLEQQIRKYFSFASNSLDYVAEILGHGGKDPMEFNDWVKIAEYLELKRFENPLDDLYKPVIYHYCLLQFGKDYATVIKDGQDALKKMQTYNRRDVKITNACILDVEPYVNFKFSDRDGTDYCKHCECITLNKHRTQYVRNWIHYAEFDCQACGKYKGRQKIGTTGKLSKVKQYG